MKAPYAKRQTRYPHQGGRKTFQERVNIETSKVISLAAESFTEGELTHEQAMELIEDREQQVAELMNQQFRQSVPYQEVAELITNLDPKVIVDYQYFLNPFQNRLSHATFVPDKAAEALQCTTQAITAHMPQLNQAGLVSTCRYKHTTCHGWADDFHDHDYDVRIRWEDRLLA